MNRSPRIDVARLRQTLAGINRFGFNPETGGYNRLGYSEADMAARAWFENEMRASGLVVRRDAVANLFGRFGPDNGPRIMAGSHLDTVPEGGAFDGALGTCIGLECVRAMQDAGLEPAHPIEVVATAEEEGRFGGMLGSRTMAGLVTREGIESAAGPDGTTLSAAMAAHGLRALDALHAGLPEGHAKAWLELHIEQGPVLEAAGIPVGIVSSVAGVCNLNISFEGRANHSGTTPMHLRADALAGLVAVSTAIAALIEENGTEHSRITIGKADLYPNHVHTVPGRCEFVANIRDIDADIMRRLRDRIEGTAYKAANAHGLICHVNETTWLDPVTLDPGLADLLRDEAARLGLRAKTMPSGAGHDAQTMQNLCPSALIFIPSRNGVSHSPEEWSDWAHVEQGANLMLAALVRLSQA